MTEHDCIHYDKDNGWCKKFSDWSNDMPNIEYCLEGPCPYQRQRSNRITIDAKYDIGDEVWFVDYYYDMFFPVKYSGKVNEIEIEITESQQSIYYWIIVNYDGNIEYEKYAEAACFSSYEECEEWCKKKN
jgi:hypothetical protein